jgi:hypothetical protein
MYANQTKTTVAPTKSFKARVWSNMGYVSRRGKRFFGFIFDSFVVALHLKPKIMARLPFTKQAQGTQQPSLAQKAKLNAKGKSRLPPVHPKVMSKNKNDTLAVPGVPVEHSSIFYAALAQKI